MAARGLICLAAALAWLAAAGSVLAQDRGAGDTGAGDTGVGESGAEKGDPVARGRYLLHAGGCVTCHTAKGRDAVPLAGGLALETPFGTFHAPNITPDPETGLGDWSEEQFLDALLRGIAPDDRPYYPAFPYTSYSGMTEQDARDIFAYLQSLEPARNAVGGHELDFPYGIRLALWPWRWLHFEEGTFQPDPERSDSWNRGAYLVRHLGHCGECHTPRGYLGERLEARDLAGNPSGPDGKRVPNITPHPEDGIGGWSEVDLTFFLKTGFLPDGDVAGGSMGAVIKDSTSLLSDEDRSAIATYLLSLEPQPDE